MNVVYMINHTCRICEVKKCDLKSIDYIEAQG